MLDHHEEARRFAAAWAEERSLPLDLVEDAQAAAIMGLATAALTYHPTLHGENFWGHAERLVRAEIHRWHHLHAAACG